MNTHVEATRKLTDEERESVYVTFERSDLSHIKVQFPKVMFSFHDNFTVAVLSIKMRSGALKLFAGAAKRNPNPGPADPKTGKRRAPDKPSQVTGRAKALNAAAHVAAGYFLEKE